MTGGGGPNDGRWIGPFGPVIHTLLLSLFISQEMGMMLAELNQGPDHPGRHDALG